MTAEGATARRPLGILMLAGKMADVPGCMACEATFPYPVVRKVVAGSRTPLSAGEAREMLPLYVAAARELVRDGRQGRDGRQERQGRQGRQGHRGVAALTANCGLIALLQRELAAAVEVPVVTSALLLVPAIHRWIGGRRVGILTFFTSAVGEDNYRASGWSANDVPVALDGVGEHESWREFLRTKEVSPALRAQLSADLLAVVRRLLARHPDVGALVSECTMLPACLEAVRAAVPLPVYDILTALDLAMAGSFRPAAATPGSAWPAAAMPGSVSPAAAPASRRTMASGRRVAQ